MKFHWAAITSLPRADRWPRPSPGNPPGTRGGLRYFHESKFIIIVAVHAYRYLRSSTYIIDKIGVSGHAPEQESSRLRDADKGACRGHVGRLHRHCLRATALSFPRRSNLRRQCEPETTIGPLAPGPRPFPSLWNAWPPRAGCQSPVPRRSRQLDTVIRNAVKARFDPGAGLCQRLADLAGGPAGLAGRKLRRRQSVILESLSSAGFPPRGAGKSRGAIRH
jgi:hypothetical protein